MLGVVFHGFLMISLSAQEKLKSIFCCSKAGYSVVPTALTNLNSVAGPFTFAWVRVALVSSIVNRVIGPSSQELEMVDL